MEELREASIHHTALKFSEDVKQMKIYSNLYKTVQVSGCQPFGSANHKSFSVQLFSVETSVFAGSLQG